MIKLFIFVVLLAGCVKTQDTDKTVVRDEPGPNYFIHEIILESGLRCVVSTSDSSAGGTDITCDWRSNRETNL